MTKGKFDKYNFTLDDVCMCECHEKGTVVIHCTPCCSLTYNKYMNKGKLQVAKYIRLKEKEEEYERNITVG